METIANCSNGGDCDNKGMKRQTDEVALWTEQNQRTNNN